MNFLPFERISVAQMPQLLGDWPEDANELTVRLSGWFSLNLWLVC